MISKQTIQFSALDQIIIINLMQFKKQTNGWSATYLNTRKRKDDKEKDDEVLSEGWETVEEDEI